MIKFIRDAQLFPEAGPIFTLDQVRHLVPTLEAIPPALTGLGPIPNTLITYSKPQTDSAMISALCRIAQQGFNSNKIIVRDSGVIPNRSKLQKLFPKK